MKNLIVLVGVLCVVAAIPVPDKPQSSLDLLEIPLGNNKVSKHKKLLSMGISSSSFYDWMNLLAVK